MKILIIGSGGREHALAWKLDKSERVSQIYCAPGNGGTSQLGENVNISVHDLDGLLEFALNKEIDLTIVGPEDPLVMGIVDSFNEKGLKIFGANRKAAQLEGSKEFSKKFMLRHGIDTAKYKSFTDYKEAAEALKDYSYPLVIKADGLCLGKGVIICQNKDQALEALEDIFLKKIFGDQGKLVVIEEFLDGIEASLLCFVSGNNLIPMESAKDYKKIFDNDLGPNTGGVGAYSPSPLFDDDFKERIRTEVLDKISKGLKEDGLDFYGILFIGFMIVDGKAKVLEFNVRFGDPETEVILPRLKSDLLEILEKTIDGVLKDKDLIWDDKPCVTLVATSEGYPDDYERGFEINGIKDLDSSIILFHNGTKYEEDKLVTNGGRVMSITSLGKDLQAARKNIYDNIERLVFQGMSYRKDIAKD